MNRRQFLVRTSALLGACASSPILSTARAIPPMPRTGAARLLLSLAAYSFRNSFPPTSEKPASTTAPARPMHMEGFIDYCAEHQCDGAELTSYYFPKDAPDSYFTNLRRYAFLKGIAISGTAIGNNFSLPSGDKRSAEIARCKLWIDRAALLGAPHIRVFAGHNKDLPRDEADKLVIAALEECCDYAGSKGIFLGLENHDAIGNAEHLLKLISPVRSPWLGVNLDSGNFHTEDPYADFARCAPYAVNVQLKTEVFPSASKQPLPADLPRLVRILRENGYQGFTALELEEKTDPYTAVPAVLAQLRKLL